MTSTTLLDDALTDVLAPLCDRFVKEFELKRGQRTDLAHVPYGLLGGWREDAGSWKIVADALLDPEEVAAGKDLQFEHEVLLMAHVMADPAPKAARPLLEEWEDWSGPTLLGLPTDAWLARRRRFVELLVLVKDAPYHHKKLAEHPVGTRFFVCSREKLEKRLEKAASRLGEIAEQASLRHKDLQQGLADIKARNEAMLSTIASSRLLRETDSDDRPPSADWPDALKQAVAAIDPTRPDDARARLAQAFQDAVTDLAALADPKHERHMQDLAARAKRLKDCLLNLEDRIDTNILWTLKTYLHHLVRRQWQRARKEYDILNAHCYREIGGSKSTIFLKRLLPMAEEYLGPDADAHPAAGQQ